MRIKDYEEDGEFIRVKTDASTRDFVYKKDKFSTVIELKAEISKSIINETKINDKKANKLKQLKQELDIEVGTHE